MKVAHKNEQYLATGEGKYGLFLKQNFMNFQPRFYVIAAKEPVETTGGLMWGIKIVQDIENPALEPIAEVFINNEYVFLWRDQFWRVALNKDLHKIVRYVDPNERINHMLQQEWFKDIPPTCNKLLLIYQVGHQAIE